MRKDRNIFHQLLFCLSPSCARRNVEEIKCSQTWQDIDWMTGHGLAFDLISQEKKSVEGGFGILPRFYSSAEGYPYELQGLLAGTLLI